jgi:hypothetical protein
MEFNIIKNKHGITTERMKRISWPWKDMDVGDQVNIPLELAGRAQTACHVYGRGVDKKFKSKRLDDASLQVERIK